MNLQQFREMARRDQAQQRCCFACSRNVATFFDVFYIYEDATARQRPVCTRCYRILCLGQTVEDEDAIDEFVHAIGKGQIKLIDQFCRSDEAITWYKNDGSVEVYPLLGHMGPALA